MAECVQKRKEDLIVEIPLLEYFFKISSVKRIIQQREKFEYRLLRRNKQKSDFTQYITFLESIIKKVQKMGSENTQSLKLIEHHTSRITNLYYTALKYFNDDLSLWKTYLKFLVKYKLFRLLRCTLDRALLLHGHMSDEIYIFAVKQEFVDMKSIQKARELYTTGLRLHKKSSGLYFEAFKIELAFSNILANSLKKKGQEFQSNDPCLDGSIARAVFRSAVDNVKEDSSLFFKMFKESETYTFALQLTQEIKLFMQTTFSLDPTYWHTLAIDELNKSKKIEKLRIKNCLDRYDEALSVVDTDEMWNMYLTTLLRITSTTPKTEDYKRFLLQHSMVNAHKKNKLKPTHYIQWANKSLLSIIDEILDCGLEKYPYDRSILEHKVKHTIKTDKTSAYKLFKEKLDYMSPTVWITVAKQFFDDPQAKDIFEMAFGENSVCVDEVKQKLGNCYLRWLNRNVSLDCARSSYQKLVTSGGRDVSFCKTIVGIEIEQNKVDVLKTRQHFTVACMQFGKTNIDLWMDRIFFELKFGSPRTVSSVYHEALTTLNNEDSDKFVELYTLKMSQGHHSTF